MWNKITYEIIEEVGKIEKFLKWFMASFILGIVGLINGLIFTVYFVGK